MPLCGNACLMLGVTCKAWLCHYTVLRCTLVLQPPWSQSSYHVFLFVYDTPRCANDRPELQDRQTLIFTVPLHTVP